MAKENSILMLQGNIGNFSFYKTKEGSMVRMKGGVEKGRILNDPKFARTRENMQEFGITAGIGKQIRNAVSAFVRKTSDGKASNRLTSVLTKVKQMDESSMRGERSPAVGFAVIAGKKLLEGFDFNSGSQLRSLLTVPYQVDPVTGIFSISEFSPNSSILLPKEATHLQMTIAAAGFDADLKTSNTVYGNSLNMSKDAASAPLSLDPGGVPTLTDVVMYFLLIEFFQEVNGNQYPLNNNQFNCLNIVKMV